MTAARSFPQQAVGERFALPAMIRARDLTWQALRRIAAAIRPGLTEGEALVLAEAVLADMGMERLWHRNIVRFGPETLKIFSADFSSDTVLRDDEPDWVNTIFLSTRFKAWRVGGYNEYLYTFFKCLTDERIAYADGWFAEAHDDTSTVTLDGWEVQRRCPHLKADLSKFGVVEGSTLTCNLHGWAWDLNTGKCLTTKGHPLRCAKL